MRDVAGLILSVGLPWLAGTLGVLALRPAKDRVDWLLAIAYGYPIGAFAATLLLRALSAAGIHWTLPVIGLPMLALIVLLLWLTRNALRSQVHVGLFSPGRPAMPWWPRLLLVACLAMIVIRVAGLAAEVALRPLLPWDAWAHWGTKAKVWFETGWMAPFVAQGQWLAAGDLTRYIDSQPHYPPTVPLLQVWTSIWLGRWDESLMNAPWVAMVIALGLAFYSQLRRANIGPASAMLFTYLLLSLPFLNIHVALAGIADIFIAIAYGMAVMALWQWTQTRARSDLVLAAAMIAVLVSSKVEGMLWALTLIPPLIVARHRRLGLWLLSAVALAALAYPVLGPDRIEMFGYVLRNRLTNVSRTLAEHLFIMDNWHLLWYAAIAVVALRFRRLLEPKYVAMTVIMTSGAGFVFIVYFFTNAAGGVNDESLVNRLLLHMVPALAFYLALLVRMPEAEGMPATRNGLVSTPGVRV